MLYVETNNPQEQQALQQQFSREGNLFGVPIKKTCQIGHMLSTLLFQIFDEPDSPKQVRKKPSHPLSKLVEKLSHLFDNILRLTFSLSQIRQILEIIKMESTKISLYEEYIHELNRRLTYDSQEQPDDQFHATNLGRCLQQEVNSQQQLPPNRRNNEIFEVSFTNYQGKNEYDAQLESAVSKGKNSIEFIQSKYDSPADEDAQTMHTLKSQITSSPKFSLTPFVEIQLDKKVPTNCKLDRLENSLHYSEDDKKEEEQDLVNVKDQYRMQSQSSTHSIFYCPEWKKNEDDQKKGAMNLAPAQPKKTGVNDSSYIENLSGRVHPVPSFLHDDSLGEMIVKQKKEDVRKSNILKKSMHGVDQNKIASNQYAYSSNLRLIKYHNKLRRNSKKSLASKKDIDELKQQQVNQLDPKKLAKEKNINFKSDERLLRPKELILQNSRKTERIEEVIESKLNSERKLTQTKGRGRKNSNFFKALAQ